MNARTLARRLSRNATETRALRRRLDDAPARRRLPFGLPWCATYLKHYGFRADPRHAADFHRSLCDDLSAFHATRGNKLAVVAPREGAKSTIITLAYVLYCAVEGHEPYIGITSDAAGQASLRLGEVRRELETNEALARDYPAAVGKGPEWKQDRIELRNGVVVQSFGVGQRILGRRNRQHRFTLIVFDDVENTDSVMSPVKREAAWRWATRAVIPAGSASTNFLSVGSARHRECVAVRLGQLAGWSNRLHKAVHRWPDDLDLWDEWEAVATNLADANRKDTARTFYEARRAAMDAGAETYWPARWPLYDLMTRRAEVGRVGFNSEWNGVPGVEGATEWPAAWFEWPDRWFSEWPPDIAWRVQSLDPSKGIADAVGDFQAHILMGLDCRGTFYIEADLRREDIEACVARAIDHALRFRPLVLEAEGNSTMGLLMPQFAQQCADRQRRKRPHLVNYQEYTATEPKRWRILQGGKYLGRRNPQYGPMVRVKDTAGGRLLVDQWRDYPNGEFDDGIDAVGTAMMRLEHIVSGGT